jgi:outer membrane biosynthesis protein TonB
MPLEFALRSRIKLERPAPRRRPHWLRVPPLALPIGIYWLALAGGFWAIRSLAASTAAEVDSELSQTPGASEVAEAPSWLPSPVAASAPSADAQTVARAVAQTVVDPPASRDFEPPEQAPPAKQPLEAPQANRPIEAPPEVRSFVAQRAQPAQRAVASRDETPRQTEPRNQERPAPTSPAEELFAFPTAAPREPPVDDASPAPPRAASDAASLPSCEAAAASADETLDFGSTRRQRAPDLTRDAFARVLENGAYLGRCPIPASTALEICAAVRDGKVVGLSVSSQPRSPAITACVRRAVAALRFPHSSRLDVTRTRFEATSPSRSP